MFSIAACCVCRSIRLLSQHKAQMTSCQDVDRISCISPQRLMRRFSMTCVNREIQTDTLLQFVQRACTLQNWIQIPNRLYSSVMDILHCNVISKVAWYKRKGRRFQAEILKKSSKLSPYQFSMTDFTARLQPSSKRFFEVRKRVKTLDIHRKPQIRETTKVKTHQQDVFKACWCTPVESSRDVKTGLLFTIVCLLLF